MGLWYRTFGTIFSSRASGYAVSDRGGDAADVKYNAGSVAKDAASAILPDCMR